jgi:hypothetical protein
MPLNRYENIARRLTECARRWISASVRTTGTAHGCAVMVAQSMALAHMGAVHGSILLQMAALMEVVHENCGDEP